MVSRVNCVGVGAAASAVLCCLSSASATPVTVQSVHWEFYQGGVALEAPDSPLVVQDVYRDLSTNSVKRVIGDTSFRSTASLASDTFESPRGRVFTSTASLFAEAEVWEGATEGLANAFTTLSMYSVEFLVSDRPQVYTGEHELMSKDGPIGSGSLLDPGLYSFHYFNPLGLDLNVNAGPGDTHDAAMTHEFRFEFTTVPTPGAAALAAPALALALRRRRSGPRGA